MKKIISVFLAVVCLFSYAAYADTNDISIYIDGNEMLTDPKPIITDGRTMVPLRGIFETVGAEVLYDDITRKITVIYKENIIVLSPGFGAALVNGTAKSLDVPPQIVNNRTMIPLRFISESVGFEVNYNEQLKRVTIDTGNEQVPSIPIINVTASKHDGNRPQGAADGDYNTRWSADGQNVWILFELESVQNVGYAGISWYCGDERYAVFDLYTSVDGENYTLRFSGKQPELTLNMLPYDLGGEECKYIKLVGFANTENEWNSITEFKAYPPMADGSMPVEDAGLTSTKIEIDEKEVPQEIKDSLLVFDSLLNKETLQWLVDLYDPETGAFYYVKSGAENEGFGPDAEATSFALSILQSGGICAEGLPDWWSEKLCTWVQGNQDPDDGYFYHKQWGKTTGVRRDRDNAYSMEILTRNGYQPLYLTAQERLAQILEQVNQDNSSQQNEAEVTVNVPEHLMNKDAFIKYLDQLDWSTSGIYGTGDSLAASKSTIAAAGLLDVLLDYLIEKQNKETGMWGEGKEYNNINGAMKISTLFVSNRTYPNVDKLIDTVIYIMENVPIPAGMTAPELWNAAYVILAAMSTQTELDSIKDKLFENGVDFINFMYENCLVYKREDGGFSVRTEGGQSAISGGSTVGLGLSESDMDGTAIISERIRSTLYGMFGLTPEKTYFKQYEDWFLESIKNKQPIVKKSADITYDFEKDEIGTQPKGWTMSAGLAEVVKDPCNPKANKCLRFSKSQTNVYQYVEYKIPEGKDFEKATFKCDLMLKETGRDDFFYNTFGGSSSNGCVQWLIKGNNRLGFRKSGNSIGETIGKQLNSNEWYKYMIEYIPKGISDSIVRFYIDDQLIKEANAIYLGPDGTAIEPKKSINAITFESFLSGLGIFYVDNISVNYEKVK